MIENARKKYEALNNFARAYHELRKCGVDFVLDDEDTGISRRMEFVDVDTEEHLGEYVTADFLQGITGQIFDELALSSEAFPWNDDGDTTIIQEDN